MQRDSELPRFYLIVDDVSWLQRFLPKTKLKFVQLRIKNKPMHNIAQQIQEAKQLCNKHSVRLVINDYWQLASKLGCDYVHLGQEDLQAADFDLLKQHGIRIGISTHSPDELKVALSLKPDYIAIGPVYKTQLKKMPWQPHGPVGVKVWKKHISGQCPLVAIGGLTVENARAIYESGADSIAVVTDVLWNTKPEERIAQWIDISCSNSGQT